jgi:hypothetical protein
MQEIDNKFEKIIHDIAGISDMHRFHERLDGIGKDISAIKESINKDISVVGQKLIYLTGKLENHVENSITRTDIKNSISDHSDYCNRQLMLEYTKANNILWIKLVTSLSAVGAAGATIFHYLVRF